MRRFCCLLVLLFVVLNAGMAQETTPQSALDYNARGLIRYNHRDYDGALADFDKSIALDPGFWPSYMVRGNARESKGDYDGAIADYNKAIDLNPTFGRTYNDRGHARYQKGDYDGAMADLNKAIEFDPENAPAYANRGRARFSRADYDGAIADYDKAIDLDPKADAYSGRGLARHAGNDLEGAIADFNGAIILDANYAEAYRGRGDVRVQQDDLDGAMADFDKALALNPNYADAYRSRGIARSNKGELEAAISEFTKAIAISPKLAPAYYDRAWNYLYQARGDSAYADAVDYLRLTRADKSGQFRLYMVIVGYFGLRQARKNGEAKAFIDAHALDFDTSDWPYLLMRYLRHEMAAPELLNLAVDKDKKTEVRARVYVGMDASLLGQRELALAHLRWVKENSTKPSREYTLAVSEITRLEAAPKPTPKRPQD